MSLVHWEDRDWIRLGECNRCGECCVGWRNPCPEMEVLPDNRVGCRIYERRGLADDPHVLDVCGVMTTACAAFPHDPGDLRSPVIHNRCGYWFEPVEKILVACPTCDLKEYAWERWLAAVRTLTYPNLGFLVVDNSLDSGFYDRHSSEVPMLRLDVIPEQPMARITASMEVIRRYFLDGSWDRWMNIEADVIVPPDTIETLLRYGGEADWISHGYPQRGGDQNVEAQQGIGCSLLKRNLIQQLGWQDAGSDGPDCWLWDLVRHAARFQTTELWGRMKILHLGN